ncbi:MAG: hypothetical protein H7306_12960 [Bacteriovorax sp.]|nr:hypothetical protein [Rhizobacter sp.]
MTKTGWTRQLRGALALLLLGALALGNASAQDANTMRARHASLSEQLAKNPFQRPLHLESTQDSGNLKGEVYAVVDQPFSVMSEALQGMDHWCDLLILHLNVKSCAFTSKPTDVLSLYVGRKFDQPLEDAYRVNFSYSVPAASADYLRVQLAADDGPMSTRDYRLALEAVPLDAKRSFIHMSYSYGYGVAARLAMQGYLATVGRDKIGFSIVSKDADGKPVYVDGVRGVVERNTMRYYLAIEAYLGAYGSPPAEQQEKRLRDWFAATERHALQLHETERNDYLEMKRREVQRQQSGAKAAKG